MDGGASGERPREKEPAGIRHLLGANRRSEKINRGEEAGGGAASKEDLAGATVGVRNGSGAHEGGTA